MFEQVEHEVKALMDRLDRAARELGLLDLPVLPGARRERGADQAKLPRLLAHRADLVGQPAIVLPAAPGYLYLQKEQVREREGDDKAALEQRPPKVARKVSRGVMKGQL